MEQTTERIESEIQEGQDALRANLDELRDRVHSATDWRRQFRAHPALGVGVAFGAGLLLANLLRPRMSRARSYPPLRHYAPRTYEPRASHASRGQLSNAWEAIQSAVIGMAANKVTSTLADWVPGLRKHFAGNGTTGNGHGTHGEGNYAATRRYRADVERYVRSADIGAAARAAEPRSSAEAEELEAAEDEGRSRAKHS